MGDVEPAGAGAEGDGGAVRGYGDGGHGGEVDGDAVADAGACAEGGVAAGFDGEGYSGRGQELEGRGDIRGGGWADEAGRGEVGLSSGPVVVRRCVVERAGVCYPVWQDGLESFTLGRGSVGSGVWCWGLTVEGSRGTTALVGDR